MKLKQTFPFYLKLASYFYPITIEKSNEPYFLELVLSKNKLILNSKNVNQSHDSLARAFHQCFQYFSVYSKPLDSILLLGMGLGSVVLLLEKYVQFQKLIANENNAQILAWLHKYYDTKSIEIINLSAENIKVVSKFELIVVDLFEDKITPQFLNEEEFWLHLKTLLTSDGILIWNTLSDCPPKVEFDLNCLFNNCLETIEGNKMYVIINR